MLYDQLFVASRRAVAVEWRDLKPILSKTLAMTGTIEIGR